MTASPRITFVFLLSATVAACGTSTPGTPAPSVVETIPADGATGVSLLPDVTVTFDRAMDPASIDTNVADDACSGTIQLSADDFATCVPMSGPPEPDGDAEAFTVTPAAPLEMLTSYKLRVRRSAKDAEGRQPRADFEMASGFTTRQGPTVVSVTPAEGATAVAGSSISITFSAPMDPATITSNDANEFCTGSVQLSADDFATCVRMKAQPSSGDGIAFTVTAAAPLASATTYRVRVTSAAESAAGDALAYEFESATGFLTRYRHTIAIDGANDFDATSERFASTSGGYFGHFAWDDTWLYFGMEGADVGGGSASHWLLLYVSGTSGMPSTTASQVYNTQEATLPFAASWHVRWRANNALTSIQRWNGAAWEESGLSIAGDVFQSGTFVEMRLRRADLLGSATTAKVHLSMVNEGNGVEFTYAGVPSGTFTDMYDPDLYTKYFELDLAGSTAPAAHVAKP